MISSVFGPLVLLVSVGFPGVSAFTQYVPFQQAIVAERSVHSSSFLSNHHVPRWQTTPKLEQMKMSLSEDDSGVSFSPLDRPVLSLIDTAALLTFAAVGKASHSADGSLDFAAVLVTAMPFLVSWFLAAPFMGCFTPEATKDVQSSVICSAKGWIVAVPLGCLLRGIIKGYVPPVPFVIVTLLSTLIILSVGRAFYTALTEVYVEML
jgi:hypothetical protein